ncbi:Sporulation related domain-containing protein [Cribrihabitans marinus]|uniref:Sporulation related domain-containing protein n=1 Tax=Cribrihabitans marinus TaxID=1227549 RepID=A0A1H6TH91_9RHOB|nr:trypsin-like peptidase domain-containing protein [Cribrihabitans marinus]GGH22008.1 peptidoglycan-binding protein [Cribrihabitans marinus]SEI77544.1 Sporulation related domain-containing protein [Cribrihabitans marinus]
MIRVFLAACLALTWLAHSASAQQQEAWVQIEAHNSLAEAQDRARIYSGALADVHGFSLGNGWYGIVLGPYSRPDAERVLQVYRAERQIPSDSFITFSRALRQPFWPVGANALNRGVVTSPLPTPEQETAEPVTPQPTDETPAEARAGERLLTAQERRDLQTALQAAGFYGAAIDGAFGAGTRRSMAAWQASKGYEATGILTTAQRKALMDEYNAPLISVGMARHTDAQAGIAIDLPLGEVAFDRYEPPFAHFEASGDLGARVLLISQPGDRAVLHGLYDIMQTLEIVPLNGPRERRGDRFTLEGRGNGIVSYTEASVADGHVKGFTLVWPEGDEARRARVLSAMQSSFERLGGVLDPGAGEAAAKDIDLVSGLKLRKPRLSRSGFFVDPAGTVVTVAEAVRGCARITLDSTHVAEVVDEDAGLGVAVLRPTEPLAPMAVAELRGAEPRLQSDVAVSGYSYEGRLGAPTLTFGTVSDLQGLDGERQLKRLALAAQSGDAGGPVLDTGGAVVGMLLPDPGADRKLPDEVSLAADAGALSAMLAAKGITATESGTQGDVTPNELDRRALGMTVLVSCWD